MKLSLNHATSAGLLSLIVAALQIPFWYLYLFTSSPRVLSPMDAAIHQISFTFSADNPYQWWFVWFTTMTVTALLMGIAYLAHAASRKAGAIVLFCIAAITTLSALACDEWSTALLLTLPLYFGMQCIRDTHKPASQTDLLV